MPQAGFEPTISAGERPQTCALDRVVTGIIHYIITKNTFCSKMDNFLTLLQVECVITVCLERVKQSNGR